MKLKHIASNMTELYLANGTILCFSYDTLVAVYHPIPTGKVYTSKLMITDKKYSVSTTRHINKWKKLFANNTDIQHVNPEVFDYILKLADSTTNERLSE